MQMASAMDTENGEMIVKRVSVPIGLEELMEGLTKEVILKKPKDIYVFAAEYFTHLLEMRDKGYFRGIPKRAQSVTKQFTSRSRINSPLKQAQRSVTPLKKSNSPTKNYLEKRKSRLQKNGELSSDQSDKIKESSRSRERSTSSSTRTVRSQVAQAKSGSIKASSKKVSPREVKNDNKSATEQDDMVHQCVKVKKIIPGKQDDCIGCSMKRDGAVNLVNKNKKIMKSDEVISEIEKQIVVDDGKENIAASQRKSKGALNKNKKKNKDNHVEVAPLKTETIDYKEKNNKETIEKKTVEVKKKTEPRTEQYQNEIKERKDVGLNKTVEILQSGEITDTQKEEEKTQKNNDEFGADTNVSIKNNVESSKDEENVEEVKVMDQQETKEPRGTSSEEKGEGNNLPAEENTQTIEDKHETKQKMKEENIKQEEGEAENIEEILRNNPREKVHDVSNEKEINNQKDHYETVIETKKEVRDKIDNEHVEKVSNSRIAENDEIKKDESSKKAKAKIGKQKTSDQEEQDGTTKEILKNDALGHKIGEEIGSLKLNKNDKPNKEAKEDERAKVKTVQRENGVEEETIKEERTSNNSSEKEKLENNNKQSREADPNDKQTAEKNGPKLEDFEKNTLDKKDENLEKLSEQSDIANKENNFNQVDGESNNSSITNNFEKIKTGEIYDVKSNISMEDHVEQIDKESGEKIITPNDEKTKEKNTFSMSELRREINEAQTSEGDNERKKEDWGAELTVDKKQLQAFLDTEVENYDSEKKTILKSIYIPLKEEDVLKLEQGEEEEVKKEQQYSEETSPTLLESPKKENKDNLENVIEEDSKDSPSTHQNIDTDNKVIIFEKREKNVSSNLQNKNEEGKVEDTEQKQQEIQEKQISDNKKESPNTENKESKNSEIMQENKAAHVELNKSNKNGKHEDKISAKNERPMNNLEKEKTNAEEENDKKSETAINISKGEEVAKEDKDVDMVESNIPSQNIKNSPKTEDVLRTGEKDGNEKDVSNSASKDQAKSECGKIEEDKKQIPVDGKNNKEHKSDESKEDNEISKSNESQIEQQAIATNSGVTMEQSHIEAKKQDSQNLKESIEVESVKINNLAKFNDIEKAKGNITDAIKEESSSAENEPNLKSKTISKDNNNTHEEAISKVKSKVENNYEKEGQTEEEKVKNEKETVFEGNDSKDRKGKGADDEKKESNNNITSGSVQNIKKEAKDIIDQDQNTKNSTDTIDNSQENELMESKESAKLAANKDLDKSKNNEGESQVDLKSKDEKISEEVKTEDKDQKIKEEAKDITDQDKDTKILTDIIDNSKENGLMVSKGSAKLPANKDLGKSENDGGESQVDLKSNDEMISGEIKTEDKNQKIISEEPNEHKEKSVEIAEKETNNENQNLNKVKEKTVIIEKKPAEDLNNEVRKEDVLETSKELAQTDNKQPSAEKKKLKSAKSAKSLLPTPRKASAPNYKQAKEDIKLKNRPDKSLSQDHIKSKPSEIDKEKDTQKRTKRINSVDSIKKDTLRKSISKTKLKEQPQTRSKQSSSLGIKQLSGSKSVNEETKVKKVAAAVKIQALWRGHRVRRNLQMHNQEMKMADAVLKIQAIWRGFRVRSLKKRGELFGNAIDKEAETHKQEELKAVKKPKDQKTAAAKIQAVWRGYKVRKSIKEVDKRLESLQKPGECDEMPHQKGISDKDIYKAASKIQAGVRGYIVRKNKKQLKPNLGNISEEVDNTKKISDDEIINALNNLEKIPDDSPKRLKRSLTLHESPKIDNKLVKNLSADSPKASIQKLKYNSLNDDFDSDKASLGEKKQEVISDLSKADVPNKEISYESAPTRPVTSDIITGEIINTSGVCKTEPLSSVNGSVVDKIDGEASEKRSPSLESSTSVDSVNTVIYNEAYDTKIKGEDSEKRFDISELKREIHETQKSGDGDVDKKKDDWGAAITIDKKELQQFLNTEVENYDSEKKTELKSVYIPLKEEDVVKLKKEKEEHEKEAEEKKKSFDMSELRRELYEAQKSDDEELDKNKTKSDWGTEIVVDKKEMQEFLKTEVENYVSEKKNVVKSVYIPLKQEEQKEEAENTDKQRSGMDETGQNKVENSLEKISELKEQPAESSQKQRISYKEEIVTPKENKEELTKVAQYDERETEREKEKKFDISELRREILESQKSEDADVSKDRMIEETGKKKNEVVADKSIKVENYDSQHGKDKEGLTAVKDEEGIKEEVSSVKDRTANFKNDNSTKIETRSKSPDQTSYKVSETDKPLEQSKKSELDESVESEAMRNNEKMRDDANLKKISESVQKKEILNSAESLQKVDEKSQDEKKILDSKVISNEKELPISKSDKNKEIKEPENEKRIQSKEIKTDSRNGTAKDNDKRSTDLQIMKEETVEKNIKSTKTENETKNFPEQKSFDIEKLRNELKDAQMPEKGEKCVDTEILTRDREKSEKAENKNVSSESIDDSEKQTLSIDEKEATKKSLLNTDANLINDKTLDQVGRYDKFDKEKLRQELEDAQSIASEANIDPKQEEKYRNDDKEAVNKVKAETQHDGSDDDHQQAIEENNNEINPQVDEIVIDKKEIQEFLDTELENYDSEEKTKLKSVYIPLKEEDVLKLEKEEEMKKAEAKMQESVPQTKSDRFDISKLRRELEESQKSEEELSNTDEKSEEKKVDNEEKHVQAVVISSKYKEADKKIDEKELPSANKFDIEQLRKELKSAEEVNKEVEPNMVKTETENNKLNMPTLASEIEKSAEQFEKLPSKKIEEIKNKANEALNKSIKDDLKPMLSNSSENKPNPTALKDEILTRSTNFLSPDLISDEEATREIEEILDDHSRRIHVPLRELEEIKEEESENNFVDSLENSVGDDDEKESISLQHTGEFHDSAMNFLADTRDENRKPREKSDKNETATPRPTNLKENSEAKNDNKMDPNEIGNTDKKDAIAEEEIAENKILQQQDKDNSIRSKREAVKEQKVVPELTNTKEDITIKSDGIVKKMEAELEREKPQIKIIKENQKNLTESKELEVKDDACKNDKISSNQNIDPEKTKVEQIYKQEVKSKTQFERITDGRSSDNSKGDSNTSQEPKKANEAENNPLEKYSKIDIKTKTDREKAEDSSKESSLKVDDVTKEISANKSLETKMQFEKELMKNDESVKISSDYKETRDNITEGKTQSEIENQIDTTRKNYTGNLEDSSVTISKSISEPEELKKEVSPAELSKTNMESGKELLEKTNSSDNSVEKLKTSKNFMQTEIKNEFGIEKSTDIKQEAHKSINKNADSKEKVKESTKNVEIDQETSKGSKDMTKYISGIKDIMSENKKEEKNDNDSKKTTTENQKKTEDSSSEMNRNNSKSEELKDKRITKKEDRDVSISKKGDRNIFEDIKGKEAQIGQINSEDSLKEVAESDSKLKKTKNQTKTENSEGKSKDSLGKTAESNLKVEEVKNEPMEEAEKVSSDSIKPNSTINQDNSDIHGQKSELIIDESSRKLNEISPATHLPSAPPHQDLQQPPELPPRRSSPSINLLHSGELHETITVPISLSPTAQPASPPGLVSTGTDPASTLPVQLNEAAPAGAALLTSPPSESFSAGAHASNKDASTCIDATDAASMETEKRNNASVQQKNKKSAMEVEAATKIQAGFRGYRVRKQLKNKISSPGDISSQRRSARRKSSGRLDSPRLSQKTPSKAPPSPSDLEERSAVKIQAGVRGFLVRRRQKKDQKQSNNKQAS